MFVCRPHVTGPEGNVTTPDVIVDYLLINGERHSPHLLSHECWRQVGHDEVGQPGYAILALGGGSVILPGVLFSTGQAVISRRAWRLANLNDHVGDVTLNGTRLADAGLPVKLIEAAGGAGDTLPRGFLLLQTISTNSTSAVLTDPVLSRELRHQVFLEQLEVDRWGDTRPSPRYSVGPTLKEVTHFI